MSHDRKSHDRKSHDRTSHDRTSKNGPRQTDDRDGVGTLVRLAGKRRAVPAERTERVRAAAHAEWQRGVRRRSRRRYAWAAAAVVAAASLALMLVVRGPFGVPSATQPTTVVESMTGTVWIRGTETAVSRFLRVGDDVPLGSGLRSAKGGRVAIRLASGHSLRLDTSTEIRMLGGGRIALDWGTIYVDSGTGSTTIDALAVTTPFGEIHEAGTQFEVRSEDDFLRVRLREGTVDVRREDEILHVAEGTELTIDSDGLATRRDIQAHGHEWAWLVDVTPMIDIQGRPARAFLDWVARERGWSLTFTDDDVARNADQIVLEGTLEGLTIDQALDAVLPTCRMTHRIEDGVLSVGLIGEDGGD